LESDEEMYGKLIESQKTLSQIIGNGEEGYEPFFFELPFTLDADIAFNDRYIAHEPFEIVKSGEGYIVKESIFQEIPEVKNRWDKLHFLMPDFDHPITRRFYQDNIVLYVSPTVLKNLRADQLRFLYFYKWEQEATWRTKLIKEFREVEVEPSSFTPSYIPSQGYDRENYIRQQEEAAVREYERKLDTMERFSNAMDGRGPFTDPERYGVDGDVNSYLTERLNREYAKDYIREKARKKAAKNYTPQNDYLDPILALQIAAQEYDRQHPQAQIRTIETTRKEQVPATNIDYGKCAVAGICGDTLATIFIPRTNQISMNRVMVDGVISDFLSAGKRVYQVQNIRSQPVDMNTLLYRLGKEYGKYMLDYDVYGPRIDELTYEQWRHWNEGIWVSKVSNA